MIIRRHGDHHFLLPQPEHARQSAMIVSYLKPEFLGDGERQSEIIMATKHHDDGWRKWEDAPQRAANGLPVNFLEMDSGAHHEVWFRTIFDNLRERGPAVATLIARHGAELLGHDDTMKAHFDGVLATLRKSAWPELSDEASQFRMERGFAALFFADGLSLAASAVLDREWKFQLLREDRSSIEITARFLRDWTVSVDPWPFCVDRLDNIFVDAIIVPVGQEQFACDFFLKRADHRVRVNINYVPV